MIEYSKIQSVIQTTRPVQKTGQGFRVCGMSHKNQYLRPLDGDGAMYADGRFHLKKMAKVTYVAKDIRTAMLESRKALLDSEGGILRGSHSTPFVIYSVTFNLRKILEVIQKFDTVVNC